MKRHALFVGVDRYVDGHIPNLSFAVNDATDLHGFFKFGAGYDKVELLQNPSGKKDILGSVRDLTVDLGPGDFFLFFFAGHGFRVGENHVLVCAKDFYEDVKYEYDGLPLGQLKRHLSGAFDKAMVLDACQSDILATRGGEGIAERDLDLILDASQDGIGGGSLTIVTSCDVGQTAAELAERRHGLFTVAMLDLLNEARVSNARIDFSDVFRQNLTRRMCEIAAQSGLHTEQRPRFNCVGSSCHVLLDGAVVSPIAQVPFCATELTTATPTYVVCPECGKYNIITETFKCKVCDRDYLCMGHYSAKSLSCVKCNEDRSAEEIKRLFETKYDEVKRERHHIVGVAIGPGICRMKDGGWLCQYENSCTIAVRPNSNTAYEVHGGICDRWNREGAVSKSKEEGGLGYPISDEESCLLKGDSNDRISHFENGDIIWIASRNETIVEYREKCLAPKEIESECYTFTNESGKKDLNSIRRVQLWRDGPYWADRNIGAENPWDSGYYFWWGDTVGYKWVNDEWVASDGSNYNFSFKDDNVLTCSGWLGKSIGKLRRYGWISASHHLTPDHDAAQKHWGGDWRMPTDKELRDLRKLCDWTWTKVKGVNGYVVQGKGSYSSAEIFLPCAGYGAWASLDDAGSYGYYWSSVPYSHSYLSWGLNFGSSYYNTTTARNFGQSVRPLQGFPK